MVEHFSLDASTKIEGFLQTLKKEVELLGRMTRCMDAFLNTHTRLVVIVDGLDSCEQEKLLQVPPLLCRIQCVILSDLVLCDLKVASHETAHCMIENITIKT